MLRQLRFEWRKNMSASWLFSLGTWSPSIAFCSEEIADLWHFAMTSGYFWVGRKGSCASHRRLQCGDRWERSTALRGKRLEAGCEWMGWQNLVLSTWGFQVWWIAGSISRCLVSSGPLWNMIGVPFVMKPNCEKGRSDILSAWFPWSRPIVWRNFSRHLLFGWLGTSFSWYRICCWKRSPSSLCAVQIDAEVCVGATHGSVKFWDS